MNPNTLGVYDILDELGRGPSAAVFQAGNRTTKKHVALKIFNPDAVSDSDVVRALQRAVVISSGLDHANIVKVIDIDETDGIHYIAMEYIDGVALRALLEHYSKFEMIQACRVIQAIAQGLAFAHRSDICHGNLIPENIVVERQTGRVVITDFGVSRVLVIANSRIANDLERVGFQAPELALGAQPDTHSDVFSLGALLYYLLSGEHPAPGLVSTPGPALPQMPRLRSLVPNLPIWLETVVARCMTADPIERMNSAADIVDELEVGLESEENGPPLTPTPQLERTAVEPPQPVSQRPSPHGDTRLLRSKTAGGTLGLLMRNRKVSTESDVAIQDAEKRLLELSFESTTTRRPSRRGQGGRNAAVQETVVHDANAEQGQSRASGDDDNAAAEDQTSTSRGTATTAPRASGRPAAGSEDFQPRDEESSQDFESRTGEPSRRPGEDPRRAGEPSHRPDDDPRRAGEPSRRPGEDPRRAGEPSRRPGEDPRRAGEPSRRPGEDPRRAGEPSRRPGEDPRRTGDPSRRRTGDDPRSGELTRGREQGSGASKFGKDLGPISRPDQTTPQFGPSTNRRDHTSPTPTSKSEPQERKASTTERSARPTKTDQNSGTVRVPLSKKPASGGGKGGILAALTVILLLVGGGVYYWMFMMPKGLVSISLQNPPTGTAELVIDQQSKNSISIIDGQGALPVPLDTEVTIRISSEGFESIDKTITVSKDNPQQPLEMSLKGKPGRLTVSYTGPQSANVTVYDGKAKVAEGKGANGVAILDKVPSEKPLRVVAMAPGFLDSTQENVKIPAIASEKAVKMELTRNRGVVDLAITGEQTRDATISVAVIESGKKVWSTTKPANGPTNMSCEIPLDKTVTIKISSNYHEAVQKTTKATRQAPEVSMAVSLVLMPRITVTTSPAKASIEVDGTAVGTTDASGQFTITRNISTGKKHRITAYKDGYLDSEKTITAKAGLQSLKLTLAKRPIAAPAPAPAAPSYEPSYSGGGGGYSGGGGGGYSGGGGGGGYSAPATAPPPVYEGGGGGDGGFGSVNAQ